MSDKKQVGVGVIGNGGRARTLVMRMAELVGETNLVPRAVHDRNVERMGEARDMYRGFFKERGVEPEIACHENLQALIDDPNVDLVMITSHSDAHREHAVAAMRSGKKVYCDKPIAASLEDSIAILEEERRTGNQMILGFTRRYEAPWRKAWELLEDGAIGDLVMIQLRAVIPYDVYFHTWHRRREWSGGALNDKSSHHFDVLNWFAGGAAWAKLFAFGGTSVYKHDPAAPETCSVCDRECPYRRGPSRILRQDEVTREGDSWTHETEERWRSNNCVFLPGSDARDHALVSVAYENGVKASLFWAIFGPALDDQEQLELVGSKGRILLTRHLGELDVAQGFRDPKTEKIDCRTPEFKSSHFGADLVLIRDMRRFFDGEAPPVSARDGYEATRMVWTTHRSIDADGELVRNGDMPHASV